MAPVPLGPVRRVVGEPREYGEPGQVGGGEAGEPHVTDLLGPADRSATEEAEG